MADIERAKIDSMILLLTDIRMAQDLEERLSAGEIELIGFADGTRIMLPVPPGKLEQLRAKKKELTDKLAQAQSALLQDE